MPKWKFLLKKILYISEKFQPQNQKIFKKWKIKKLILLNEEKYAIY